MSESMRPNHIADSSDLITPKEVVRREFLWQARQKRIRAASCVDEAAALLQVLKKIGTADELVEHQEIRPHLLAAAGLSDKAQGHFSAAQLTSLLAEIIGGLISHAQDAWPEAILYRYLLTRGAALGGSLRNVVGDRADGKFAGLVMRGVRQTHGTPAIKRNANGKVEGIRWPNRLLLFNRKSYVAGSNVDVILLDTSSEATEEKPMLESSACYVACGEIKGGIDPAGADERWKTAGSALERIRQAFGSDCPALFIAAAVFGERMAGEIYAQIEGGQLTHAANLHVHEQIEDLIAWLVSL